ncbi:hypothetical protein Acsp03_40120 [Actinomadura sp. NBRC 104412]|uniref:hypothetical protein n=1 Tax=Actinomadura sp. NBRC 104412 TaxID=3032203 RepID=UPI0024A02108|nr:hypothetical protein [Actinomadura sp. NBRC 104412]GLZ06546.1 hypothetical protein Acsp03_40120 [Actinomadura sp. NBRC 104412]
MTYPYGAATLSEFVALGADGVWWTIPRAGAAHRPSPALERDARRLHGELHTAVLVPDDHDAAVAFFTGAGGLEVLFEGEMSGDPFDRMTGMPEGAALRLTFLVARGHPPARLEIMSFRGVEAADRTASPLGLRRLVFASDDPGGDPGRPGQGGGDAPGRHHAARPGRDRAPGQARLAHANHQGARSCGSRIRKERCR